MTVQETIATAIQQRKQLQFRYHGMLRTVEPYALGYLGTGNLVLTAYQVEGKSHSKYGLGWRDFALKKIRAIHLLDEPVSAIRPNYNRFTTKYRTVLNRV